jgi:hypothetical protein
VLDYIWAGLPMVVTEGDATSEMIARFGLGRVVDYKAVEEVASTLLRLLEDTAADTSELFEEVRNVLTWERAAKPLVEFCQSTGRAPDLHHSSASRETVEGWRDIGLSDSQATIKRQQAEIIHLQKLVAGYEQGSFTSFTKWLQNLVGGTVRRD